MNRRVQIQGYEKNYSRMFLLPMVGLNYKLLPSNFVNSYILDDYKVVVVYDTTEELDSFFNDHIVTIKTYNNYLIHIEPLDDELVLYFQVPDHYKEDYDKFLRGEYSKFSNDYKTLLTIAYGRKSRKTDHLVTEYDVIIPLDFKRKQIASYLSTDNSEVNYQDIKEVWSKPDLDKEKFIAIDQLIQTQNTHTQQL